jgi:hypothetical protein
LGSQEASQGEKQEQATGGEEKNVSKPPVVELPAKEIAFFKPPRIPGKTGKG